MRIGKAITACAVAAAILIGGQGAASASTLNTPISVVDYLKSVEKDSSFAYREQLAQSHDIIGYKGTADQNLKLISLLRGTPTPVQELPVKQAKSQGKTFSVTATAYTAYCKGCSGVTATGINLRANPNQKVIAVDPRVIPLGSRVYVEGYGEAIAGDTGGLIKGAKIDLFIPSYNKAIDFGRQTIKVTILD